MTHEPRYIEAINTIRTFAAENGRTWRAKLRALWTSGRDEGALRRARNIIGPSGIDKVK